MMKTAQYYKQLKEQIPNFTNEEFLQLHIMQLKNMFHNEVASIKNSKLEFVAFTKYFADELHFNQDCLGKRLEEVTQQTAKATLQNNKHENDLMKSRKSEMSLFFTKVNTTTICFFTRKFPLINPSTDEVVGILMIAKRVDVLRQRKTIPMIFPKQEAIYHLPQESEQLTEKQSSIVACLLLGFHKRKEIAHILNKYMSHHMNEQQIKYSLQLLYERYKCNSPTELIEAMSLDNDIKYQFPAKLIPDGVIPIK